MATGHFSWRAAPTGTLAASSHPSLASPALAPAARGPWARTSKARARLAGLSFGAGQPTPAMQVYLNVTTTSGFQLLRENHSSMQQHDL